MPFLESCQIIVGLICQRILEHTCQHPHTHTQLCGAQNASIYLIIDRKGVMCPKRGAEEEPSTPANPHTTNHNNTQNELDVHTMASLALHPL